MTSDSSADAPTISLKLDSSPETLTLVRGMLGGVAELLHLDPELLDDLKTAVSEACNNVVMHAYEADGGPLWVCLYVGGEGIVVTVRDTGRGIPSSTPADDRLHGVGIPIMRALAQQMAFRPIRTGGTEVWMRFAGTREGRSLYEQPLPAAPEQGFSECLAADAVVSLSPVSFVGSVLGRLARAMAARARFSLDRFSDVYLVTDALAAHTLEAASKARVAFGLSTETRRLELTIGPFREGASSEIAAGSAPEVGSALKLLTDELQIRAQNGAEVLHVVMLDQRRTAPPSV